MAPIPLPPQLPVPIDMASNATAAPLWALHAPDEAPALAEHEPMPAAAADVLEALQPVVAEAEAECEHEPEALAVIAAPELW